MIQIEIQQAQAKAAKKSSGHAGSTQTTAAASDPNNAYSQNNLAGSQSGSSRSLDRVA
jgi:hypothetical protein